MYRTQPHTEEVQRKQTDETQKNTTVTCNKVMIIFYSQVLWERDRLLMMHTQHKTRRLAGCMKVNQIFHSKQQDIGTGNWWITSGLNREVLMTGDG